MEYISSDTNVWIDFHAIDRIKLPFCLPYTYIMNNDAILDEILSPVGLADELVKCGLVGVEITAEEFDLAEEYGTLYPRLSVYDRIALAIAKVERIVLLTGDAALRKAANNENVAILGTLGLLDLLIDGEYITEREYENCLQELLKHNGKQVRLPESEIRLRLERCKG